MVCPSISLNIKTRNDFLMTCSSLMGLAQNANVDVLPFSNITDIRTGIRKPLRLPETDDKKRNAVML
jgi:hypothetical protein